MAGEWEEGWSVDLGGGVGGGADGVAAQGKRSRDVRDSPDPGPGRRRRPLTLARWEPSARARMLKALMRYETLSDCTLDVWMLGDDHG